ncbi:fluoride efflux transporter CrcB [Flavobacterium sp.]|uniref:fluoride efflux transporter CrcB n=1 Tax=Flavobacterium sp. TaxID=239 RepID=UPI0026192E2C|nr:fluoride efflux transporter CrcB [Flavobacterium sp.]
MFKTLILVGLGGALGSILRYLTTALIQKNYPMVFPWATLVINVIGCLLIGIIMGTLEKNQITDSSMKWLLVTGFCGGYTTFSAFGLENISLLQNGHSGLAFLYIAASVVVGLLAVWLGLLLVK